MPAIVADDAFRHAGRPRGVEDIERVGRGERHAIDGPRLRLQLLPVIVAAGEHRGLAHRPLQDHAGLGLRAGFRDRGVEQRLVRDDPVDLDAAGRRYDRDRLCIVDAGRQLVRGKPPEHDRMNGADAGAGEHRDCSLRHHRHVDEHPVAGLDPERLKHAGKARGAVAQVAIGKAHDLVGDRAVPDEGEPLGMPGGDMPVERVPAGVESRPGEPAVKRRPRIIEHAVPALSPSRSPRPPPPRIPPAFPATGDRSERSHSSRPPGSIRLSTGYTHSGESRYRRNSAASAKAERLGTSDRVCSIPNWSDGLAAICPN